MKMGRKKFACLFLMLSLTTTPAFARDVAFIEPGTGGGSGTPDEAFKIEPKSDIDIGDSIINIVRRQTLFFVNQTSAPIKIEKVVLSSDSTVAAVASNDDCSKQGTLPPLSRCSIELSITPTGPGGWGIELLMTHNGPGRITRAHITGKTGGSDANDKKDRGLFLSTKDVKPIEFGDVTVNTGKIVRSALMVNDSPSPITLYSIDVVEADKSLTRLDTGCEPDMELKPGESCPVTLVWNPTSRSVISTDLIIRHSGQLGFAVMPIRGVAKGGKNTDSDDDGGSATGTASKSGGASAAATSPTPPPPSPAEIAKEVAKAVAGSKGSGSESASGATGSVHLIGTVGSRAVLLKPDGSTAIVSAGDQVDLGDGTTAKILTISSTTASILIDGKGKNLQLEAVQELKDRARASKKGGGQDVAGNGGGNNASGGGSGSSSPGLGFGGSGDSR